MRCRQTSLILLLLAIQVGSAWTLADQSAHQFTSANQPAPQAAKAGQIDCALYRLDASAGKLWIVCPNLETYAPLHILIAYTQPKNGWEALRFEECFPTKLRCVEGERSAWLLLPINDPRGKRMLAWREFLDQRVEIIISQERFPNTCAGTDSRQQ